MTDTTSTKGACEILPVDTRGRVRVSRERREVLLALATKAQYDKMVAAGLGERVRTAA
jgi:hypothetical protein